MNDPTRLEARLRRDGVDPAAKRLCRRCGQARSIVSYHEGRTTWACETPSCLAAGSPYRIRTITIQATCERCGDPGAHRLAELSNGDQVATCGTCNTMTVLGVVLPPEDEPQQEHGVR